MSSDIPVSMAATQPAADGGLMDLLGMDIGPLPPATSQQQPVGGGLLDLLSEPAPQQEAVMSQKCETMCKSCVYHVRPCIDPLVDHVYKVMSL